MNENNIINALNAYDGTQPSLEKTVAVLADELGPEWTSLIFQQLGGLPVELKEKLDHAFNYYASLTAWQEAQFYLQQDSLDIQQIKERLPVLKHWLDFFGQPGQELYQQLENITEDSSSDVVTPSGDTDSGLGQNTDTIQQENLDSLENGSQFENAFSQEDDGQEMVSQENFESAEVDNDSYENTASDLPKKQNQKTEEFNEAEYNQEDEEYNDDLETEEMPQDDTPEGFAIHKAEREIVLLDDLQSWLAARCVKLGDIEVFAYPYYGMVVDLMRQTSADIQAVLELENQDIVAHYYPDGLNELKRKKQAIDSDIQMAVENCESDTTALIEEGVDMNKVKKLLGDLDNSSDVEYAGPAPDGFELMDNEPIDEEAVKKQYQKLEERSSSDISSDILQSDEKNTSQNDQNGVQRKLSFSLKPKKG